MTEAEKWAEDFCTALATKIFSHHLHSERRSELISLLISFEAEPPGDDDASASK